MTRHLFLLLFSFLCSTHLFPPSMRPCIALRGILFLAMAHSALQLFSWSDCCQRQTRPLTTSSAILRSKSDHLWLWTASDIAPFSFAALYRTVNYYTKFSISSIPRFRELAFAAKGSQDAGIELLFSAACSFIVFREILLSGLSRMSTHSYELIIEIDRKSRIRICEESRHARKHCTRNNPQSGKTRQN